MTHEYDVIVVGGRVAGAATAMLLARQGVRTLVVDRSAPGSDTRSTHALMRGGVVQLSKWGLLGAVIDAGTPPVRTTELHLGERTEHIDIRPRAGVDALYAPRRTVLDPIVSGAAVAAGADVRFGVSVTGLLRGAADRVTGIVGKTADGARFEATARLVIGADGVNSRVARTVGAPIYERARGNGAVLYSYFEGLDVRGYEWGYEQGLGVGFIPTNDGLTNVWVGASRDRFERTVRPDPQAGFDQLLAEVAPWRLDSMRAARRVERMTLFPGLDGFKRQAHGPGWALVGDAGYFKDPLTGHGLTDAMRDAELLADAVLEMHAGVDERTALAGYQDRRDRMAADIWQLTSVVASLNWTLDELNPVLVNLSKAFGAEAAALQEKVLQAA